jgi:hypothetical protein
MGGRKIRERSIDDGSLSAGAGSLAAPSGERSLGTETTERTVWQKAHGQAPSEEAPSAP